MSQIYVVESTHPFQSFCGLAAHRSQSRANETACEMTNAMLADFWPIFSDDQETKPVATSENWAAIVQQYGDKEDFVQNEGWGQWDVSIHMVELEE